jgi:hypothetical protein
MWYGFQLIFTLKVGLKYKKYLETNNKIFSSNSTFIQD